MFFFKSVAPRSLFNHRAPGGISFAQSFRVTHMVPLRVLTKRNSVQQEARWNRCAPWCPRLIRLSGPMRAHGLPQGHKVNLDLVGHHVFRRRSQLPLMRQSRSPESGRQKPMRHSCACITSWLHHWRLIRRGPRASIFIKHFPKPQQKSSSRGRAGPELF